jgi:hypothetical protein
MAKVTKLERKEKGEVFSDGWQPKDFVFEEKVPSVFERNQQGQCRQTRRQEGFCAMSSSKWFVPYLLVVLSVWVIAPAQSFAESSIGEVDNIKLYAYGTLTGKSKTTLYIRDGVFVDELVETGPNSALHITFADDTVLRMGSKSEVVLDEFIYDPITGIGEMVTHLSIGVIRFISGKMSKQGVKILTPTAVIGIRGTDFIVSVDEGGGTSISVEEGEVGVASIGGNDAATSIGVGQIGTVTTAISTVGVSAGTSASNDPGLDADAGTSNDGGSGTSGDDGGGGNGGGGNGGGSH